jgi:ribosomal protein S18 acetylase RimI-like enzyme
VGLAIDPESVLIRQATALDAAMLAEFAERCFRGTFARDNRPDDMERYVSAAFGVAVQRAEITDPGAVVLLAETGNELAGYAHVRRWIAPAEIQSSSPIELKRFYIAPAWHGQGLASRLMEAVVDVAEQFGGDVIWLAVWERNPRAISFYRKCGFTNAGSQPFLLGDDEQTDRIMIRRMRVA